MNIVIYKGKFQYDVVNYFVDELKQAFKRMANQTLRTNIPICFHGCYSLQG